MKFFFSEKIVVNCATGGGRKLIRWSDRMQAEFAQFHRSKIILFANSCIIIN